MDRDGAKHGLAYSARAVPCVSLKRSATSSDRRNSSRCSDESRYEISMGCLERERGFEPPTLALARRCSTTELFPLASDGMRSGILPAMPHGVKASLLLSQSGQVTLNRKFQERSGGPSATIAERSGGRPPRVCGAGKPELTTPLWSVTTGTGIPEGSARQAPEGPLRRWGSAGSGGPTISARFTRRGTIHASVRTSQFIYLRRQTSQPAVNARRSECGYLS